MEVVSFRVIEGHVLCTVPMILIDSLACGAIKDMNCLTRMPDDVLGVLMDESTMTILPGSSLCAFKCRLAVLLEKGDFLSACKVAIITRPDLHNESLNRAIVVTLIVRRANP